MQVKYPRGETVFLKPIKIISNETVNNEFSLSAELVGY